MPYYTIKIKENFKKKKKEKETYTYIYLILFLVPLVLAKSQIIGQSQGTSKSHCRTGIETLEDASSPEKSAHCAGNT